MAETDNVGTIYYTVEAETDGVLNSTRNFDQGLDSLEKTVKKVDGTVDKTNRTMKGLSTTVQKTAREADAAKTSFTGLSRIIGGLLTVQGVGSLIQMAEGYNEMAERVRMATSSQEEFERVQGRLLQTANGTYRALSEAQEVYIRTADSLRSLGYSTDQVLDITDSMSYAFVKNAASTARAENALNAYSKAINKGKVDVDAWESIIAAAPSLIQDIADAAGKTSQEIRTLGASGKLTAQMLNEGLRQSFESNRQAAADMATTVRDAFQSFRNSLSAYLGQSSDVLNSTQAISAVIVTLGQNIDTLANGFLALGAGAVAKYITATGASIIASARAGLAARALAVEELNLAKAEAAATAAKLAHARANTNLSYTMGQVTAAATANAAAVTRLTAAQGALATVGGTVLRLFGGPVGLVATIATVASGYLLMKNSGDRAAQGTEEVTKSLEELIAVREQMRNGGPIISDEEQKSIKAAEIQIKEYEAAILQLVAARARLADVGDTVGANKVNEEIDKMLARIASLREQIAKLNNEIAETPDVTTEGGKETDSQKRLKAMRDELALAKLTGDEKLRLQAIQKLGNEATAEERSEAARLAVEIDKLNKAQKKQEEANAEARKAAEQNIQVISELGQQLGLAALKGEELAVAKAKLKLNPAATPEEIDQVEKMARALWSAEEAARKRAEFKDDPLKAIRGDVEPLRGGPFDDQMARFREEEKLEAERYQAQLDRLKNAKELELEIKGGYLALEEKLQKEHADRIAQIEEAKNMAILQSSEQAFGALADVIKNSAGKTSGAFKTLFAISKGFAVAQAFLNLNQAVMQAMADPSALTPQQKFANAAMVAASAGNFLSAIQGASFGGGRRHGGGVNPGKFYRVNEEGTPEMLSVGGRDYLMMGNQRGHVTPMNKAGGAGPGGGNRIEVNVHIDSGGGAPDSSASPGYEQFGREIGQYIDRRFNELQAKSMRPGGQLWNAQQRGG